MSHDLPEPASARWRVLRAGIQNLWEYDDQRFVFERGRLLLRGRNETGKTKALEVLLPFLLDADLSPQRLDPFGSRSRPMRWNLINDDNPDVGKAIGYVWLEFGRVVDGSPAFHTLGAGLQASRNAPGVQVWYFTTDRRIDRDVHLVVDRIPLTRRRLQESHEDACTVYDNKREYRYAVNAKLFGMSGDQYDALITTLLQLRRPQLSKQLQPDELSRILTASLPPLVDGIVSTLAEGFDRLDRHRSERERLATTHATVGNFLKLYGRYAGIVARGYAQEVTQSESTYHRTSARLRDLREQLSKEERLQQEFGERIEGGEEEMVVVRARLETLRSTDEYRAVQELDRARKSAREYWQVATDARQRLENDRAALSEAQGRLEQDIENVETKTRELESRMKPLATLADEASLSSEHAALSDQLLAGDVSASRGTLMGVLEEREDSIEKLLQQEKLVESASREADRARAQLAEHDERVRRGEERLHELRTEEERATSRFAESVSTWLDGIESMSLATEVMEEILDVPVEQARDVAERGASATRALIDQESVRLGTESEEIARRVDEVQAEHDRIESSDHIPPTEPRWRSEGRDDRSGGPLYMLCDPSNNVDSGHAGIEAALEGAGLLDAWVTPDGTLLDPGTWDVVLVPDPVEGRTLADALVPVEGRGVPTEIISDLLRSIPLVPSGDPGEGMDRVWVSEDGRFRLGPAHGANHKKTPEYLGSPARERTRKRRLADLASTSEELQRHRKAIQRDLEMLRMRREGIEREMKEFPSLEQVMETRTRLVSALESHGEAQVERDEAKKIASRTNESLEVATKARDGIAAGLNLLKWTDKPRELQERTMRWERALTNCIGEADKLAFLRSSVRDREKELASTRIRLDQTRDEESRARHLSDEASAHVSALEEMVDTGAKDIMSTIAEADQQLDALQKQLRHDREEKTAAARSLGALENSVKETQERLELADDTRRKASEGLRLFASTALPVETGLDIQGDPELWKHTDALLAARRIDAALEKLDHSQQALERAETRVVTRYHEMTRELPTEIRIQPRRERGALGYSVTYNAREMGLRALTDELASEIATRDKLLREEEQVLFESFLTGETHEHLSSRLREAQALVDRMNAQLAPRTTASGMRLRLRWQVHEGAPAGTEKALALMRKSGHLVSEADSKALQTFLRQRLDEARTQDGAGTLQERMAQVLDYRSWHSFYVETSEPGRPWKKLTRKAHAAGSGGQKAVMLHLPLFAAAAAFYTSAHEDSPRLIILDEAFAGIDKATRGKLMGLLAEFDLDFMMTSFDEWGFYSELDGLSTYHLSRVPEVRGVHADRFLWDGRTTTELGMG